MKQYKSHLTAISRPKLSPAMRQLDGYIDGRSLDYGCGRGQDAERLNMERYDPYYFDTQPVGQFRTITCNYVLNVIPSTCDILICLNKIQSLLTQHGTAYITVRRDIKEETVSKRGTYQRPVYLHNVDTLNANSSYETYIIYKDSNLIVSFW